MHILVVDPFFGGSHKQWAEEWKKYSRHKIDVVGLPGKYWKWRMIGSAPVLVKRIKQQKKLPDLIIYSSMADVPTIQGLLPLNWRRIPSALYMHENQILYPNPSKNTKQPKRNAAIEIKNVLSCLAVDRIFFNSHYHKTHFLQSIPTFLRRFPDYQWVQQTVNFKDKSKVLYVGIEPPNENRGLKNDNLQVPIILWNHRWEFDKGPIAFFELLMRLKERKLPFQLIATGTLRHFEPAFVEKVHKQLSDRILHWGYAENKTTYYDLLWKADIIPVTSKQDFFGISVIEAMGRKTYPLLPDRLAYPEHIPSTLRKEYMYKGIYALEKKLEALLRKPKIPDPALLNHISRYYWPNLIARYDAEMETVVKSKDSFL